MFLRLFFIRFKVDKDNYEYLKLYLVIESEYTGPKLVDGKVTKEFMEELLPHLKDQKKLHKRFAYQVCRSLLGNILAGHQCLDITHFYKFQFNLIEEL